MTGRMHTPHTQTPSPAAERVRSFPRERREAATLTRLPRGRSVHAVPRHPSAPKTPDAFRHELGRQSGGASFVEEKRAPRTPLDRTLIHQH
jgi:hypothetical protein